MLHPPSTDRWVGLSGDPLPVDAALRWVVTPSCGAAVVFCGTVRDHADGRPGVTRLDYEAYEEQVVPRLHAIADELWRRWPETGRVALLHRVGALELTEVSVCVAVSTPHRPAAFEAARFAIDTLKSTVPIWKRETWAGGTDWGTCAHPVDDLAEADAEVPGR